MKLCWEYMDHLILLPGFKEEDEDRLLYYTDIEKQEGRIQGNFDISEKPCLYCNNYFLTDVRKNQQFCDRGCKKKYNFEKNAYKKVTIDKRLKENGGGQHVKNVKHKAWNKGMKYGVIKDNASFRVFKDRLSWFVEVRPDPSNNLVLQTRCCICNKWFSPSKKRVTRIIAFANGNVIKHTWGFYCSDECAEKCPYYGKTTATIMKNDYLNSGRAKYSEIHNIPDNVLYYDWQEELRKTLDTEKHKYKKREKRKKLRRRKKRASELKRIKKREDRKKYLNSSERKKN